MRREWLVTITVVEHWGQFGAVCVRQYVVVAVSAPEAERLATDVLCQEYATDQFETKFDIREFVIVPKMCDMNAIRDGLVPVVRSAD